MIEINELRCGNLVICRNKAAEVEKISCITQEVLAQYIDDSEGKWFDDVNYLRPIHLTDAVLEACGFKMYKEHPSLLFSEVFGSIYLVQLKEGEFGVGENNRYKHRMVYLTYTIPCSTLHQLQNLYYALTGEELYIDKEKLMKAL